FEALKIRGTYGPQLPRYETFVPLIDVPGAIDGAKALARKKNGRRTLIDAAYELGDLCDSRLSNGLRRVQAPSVKMLVERAGFEKAAQAVVAVSHLDHYENRFRSLGDFLALGGNDPSAFVELAARETPERAAEVVAEGARTYRSELERVGNPSRAPDEHT